jgi:hypothetical protein
MDSHFSTGVSRPAENGNLERSGVELMQWEEDYVSCIQELFDSGLADSAPISIAFLLCFTH